MQGQLMERCDNCLKEYPESKMATHFGYCRRNIKKCPTCHQMYDINFQEQHDEEFHKTEDCPHCKRTFPSSELLKHQPKCELKPKYCEYCDLNVPVKTYPAHLRQCQSRTKPCDKCNKPITNKEYLGHIVSCPGPVEEPKPIPANNYREHIQQQRRVIEQPAPSVHQQKSRDKIPPAYQYKHPASYQYKPREERQYAPIVEKQEPRVISYQQPPRQQPPRQEIKRQSTKYAVTRQEVKKEEPKKYINSINPPAAKVISTRKEEVRNVGGKIVVNSRNQPVQEEYKRNNSRQAPKRTVVNPTNPGSNKDINPSRNQPVRHYGVTEVRSVEKKVEPRREEKPSYKDISANQPARRAPQVKTRVIYESSSQQQPQQPQNRADFLQEQYALGALDLNGEDHELQMAIMQSMGGSSKQSKNTSYSFENEWNNPSFVAQQKAIEEELAKKNRR